MPLPSLETPPAPGLAVAPEKLVTHTLCQQSYGALCDGLMLAKNLNIKKLLVEVDAMTITKIPSSDNMIFDSLHPYSAIIIYCKSLLQHFEDIQVNHIHREGNHCADILVKEGVSLDIDFLFTPIPLPLFCTSL